MPQIQTFASHVQLEHFLPCPVQDYVRVAVQELTLLVVLFPAVRALGALTRQVLAQIAVLLVVEPLAQTVLSDSQALSVASL